MSVLATGTMSRGRVVAMPGYTKWLVAVGALLAAIPQVIRDEFLVATLFIGLDTFSGLLLAAKCKEIRSNKMRQKLAIKLAQYGLIVGLCAGAGLIAHQWGPVGGALGAVISIEVLSIIENLLQLEQCGGAPLGPARPLLLKVARFFAVSQETEKGNEDEREHTGRS